ncbi:Hypothetical protein A7982_07804 [Minicystis rosea]|nr:Hypothetical protein A7982_07804 [Minicystis rosea]
MRYGEHMNRILLTLATASIFVVGCGRAALDHEAAAPAPALAAKADAKAKEEKSDDAKAAAAKAEVGSEATPEAPAHAARMPGDFVVYRFSGSFRKAPLTLSEKVVARNGSVVTIDLSLKDGDKKDELRVKIDESSPSRNEVVSVARLEGGVEKAATLEAYEALMTRTTLSADQNEAVVGTEDVTVDIGGAAVPAKRTTYRVRVGKKQATLKTFESNTFAWGDVGGEITTTNGKVLYRAEVIEAGHGDAAKAAAMAE